MNEKQKKQETEKKVIEVKLPANMTFDDGMKYILHHYGVGRVDTADDIPADNDCSEIIEIKVNWEN